MLLLLCCALPPITLSFSMAHPSRPQPRDRRAQPVRNDEEYEKFASDAERSHVTVSFLGAAFFARACAAATRAARCAATLRFACALCGCAACCGEAAGASRRTRPANGARRGALKSELWPRPSGCPCRRTTRCPTAAARPVRPQLARATLTTQSTHAQTHAHQHQHQHQHTHEHEQQTYTQTYKQTTPTQHQHTAMHY